MRKEYDHYCIVCQRHWTGYKKKPKDCDLCGSEYWNGISLWTRLQWAWEGFTYQPHKRHGARRIDGITCERME